MEKTKKVAFCGLMIIILLMNLFALPIQKVGAESDRTYITTYMDILKNLEFDYEYFDNTEYTFEDSINGRGYEKILFVYRNRQLRFFTR